MSVDQQRKQPVTRADHNPRNPYSSRKANELRVARNPISADIVLLETILHVDAPGLVEVDTAALHDAHHLLLARIVESLARVAGLEVGVEIKGGRGKSGVNVVLERGRQARVDGLGDRNEV
jgi:hypothetical protein